MRPQRIPDGAESAWRLFVVRAPAVRDDLRRRLEARGLQLCALLSRVIDNPLARKWLSCRYLRK